MSVCLWRGTGSLNAILSTEEYGLCQFVYGGVLTALMPVLLLRGTDSFNASLSQERYWRV